MTTVEPERLGDLPEHVDRVVRGGRGDCQKNHPAGTVRHPARRHCDDHPDATYQPTDVWQEPRCEVCVREATEANRREAVQRLAAEIAKRCDERFPSRYRDAVADHPDVVDWVRQYQQGPKAAPSLLIVGPTGVGKTHQAYGALRAAVVGYASNWIATTSADLVASLRPRSGVDTEQEMHRYRTTELLLMDDLGIGKQSEWVEETLYRVIGGRYEQVRPTIYTTNLDVPKLREVLGDRITSRLAETCTRVLLDGADRRRQR